MNTNSTSETTADSSSLTERFLGVARLLFGDDPPIRFETYDGKHLGSENRPTKIVLNNEEAIAHVLGSPGELGLARAFVSGDAQVEGDIFDVLSLRDFLQDQNSKVRLGELALNALRANLHSKPDAPPEEIRLHHSRLHSRSRDAAAISSHYDVSNDFYEMVLGPSFTYSCAVWESPTSTLEQAQEAKCELVCSKLGLHEGSRLLDIGCGWGTMAIHAARDHGAHVVGITISRNQAELARKRVTAAGVAHLVDIRLQDYRDVDDGPYDAISSIGMFEHVGSEKRDVYLEQCTRLLSPKGRFLNHFIARPSFPRSSAARRTAAHALDRARLLHIGQSAGLPPVRVPVRGGFIDRYVFPDGELQELGEVISASSRAGLEIRHVESLREHYGLTLRAWVKNLEDHWCEAVDEVGEGRARVWLLYMAASAVSFETGGIQIHQVLSVKPGSSGDSGMPLRPAF